MTKLFGFIGMTVASYAGWWLGEAMGSMVLAFIIGTVAGGFGMYYAARWARHNLT